MEGKLSSSVIVFCVLDLLESNAVEDTKFQSTWTSFDRQGEFERALVGKRSFSLHNHPFKGDKMRTEVSSSLTDF